MNMTPANVPSREINLITTRLTVTALVLAVLAVLSLSFPLAAPFVALVGGAVSYRAARTTASRIAWFALGVCSLVLLISVFVDLGLLATNTVEISRGPRQVTPG